MSGSNAQDTAPVRAGEELNQAKLRDYLAPFLPTPHSELVISQFPGGHSNLTYLVSADGAEYVLRRPPLGPAPPRAHDMAREFRVLQAIHPHFSLAPKPIALCEDLSIIGAPFHLMERRRGVILRTAVPPEWQAQPDTPERISRGFLDCLVQLHSVDVEAHGLTALGKPSGFVERQVRGWSQRWRNAETTPLPEADRVIRFLEDHLPPDGPPALVHNDYKLDNLVLAHDDPGRVTAVLDWEMATVGDPLVDLGLALCYWDAPDRQTQVGPVACLSQGPGWMTRAELTHEYAQRTGRNLAHLPFHEVLGIFKLAVIVQQIYFRWFRGQTRDERFSSFHIRVKSLIEAAAARAGELA